MKVVQLDKDGYFIGFSEAEESPLEPGVYLYPAGTISAGAPDKDKLAEDNTRARWLKSKWVYEKNEPVQVAPNPDSDEYKIAYCKALARDILRSTDYTQYADVALYLTNKSQFDVYRAAVRGYFLNPVADPTWPTPPTPAWGSPAPAAAITEGTPAAPPTEVAISAEDASIQPTT